MHSPYAFAQFMVSPSMTDIAVLLQLPTDNSRKLSSAVTRVHVMGYDGKAAMTLQPNSWDSCVRGTFDGRSPSGTVCTDAQRHTYASEVNHEGVKTFTYHVAHKVQPSLVHVLRNSSTVLGIETINSRNDPSMTYEVSGSIKDAIPCRRLMASHDSFYSSAKDYRSDWVTLWSLNEGNPDSRRTLIPRYFAHPLQVLRGETAYAIQRRYGMTEGEMLKVNPGIEKVGELPVGSFVCVVPNWNTVVAGNGQRVCS